ncbi:MAG TPA: 1-(5-phosphoribosyl)-5-[(5-phosphoribosylamino)methylideneamino] imidazole-4-carboxamide isomerase [Candidatus Limnocylindria bacterium]|nr:1-(5-phosphoribosyl)-5-[(5-phosphoribosylamino)methylideneamino] imidazole-4-carboxamide isomerase [Candidatus Limnocylindria bacterium]
MTFEILPALDLRGGNVVRLREGDFARETVYGDDPIATAQAFAAAGASWIHVVDLDGARGKPRQQAVIHAIVAAVADVRCQVAGGLRSPEAVTGMLSAGAERVVVGTAVLSDPSFASRLVADHGANRIVGALDVRDGQAVGDGWRAGSAGRPALDALDVLADAGIEQFAVTAITRDGQMAGPDLRLLATMVDRGRGAILASGGIASLDDLRAVRDLGCAGAIIGRALYEGSIDLADALREMAAGTR